MIRVIIRLITIILLILLTIIVITSGFLGLGYILQQLFPLGLFEATALCMLTSVILMIGLLFIRVRAYFVDYDQIEFDDSDDN